MNTDFRNTLFFAFLALGSAICLAVAMLVIVQASDANKARKATEKTQLVCFDGDTFANGTGFSECRRITWRPA